MSQSDDLFRMMTGMMDEEDVREDFLKAPFGWPGGKDLSKKVILQALPYRNGYIEHCGGSGIIALNRVPGNLNVFNDRDSGVTAFYQCIQDADLFQKLINRLELAIHSREEFIRCRKTWSCCEDPVERAARWYYIVRLSFNQQRRNFGRATSARYKNSMQSMIASSLRLFPAIHAKMKHYQIENLDIKQSLKDFNEEGLVHYIDPTYIQGDETGVCRGIYEHEMSLEDHRWVLDFIHGDGQGFYAISGYANSLYDGYKWDRRLTWPVPVKAQAQAFTKTNNRIEHKERLDRKNVTEVLWIIDKRN